MQDYIWCIIAMVIVKMNRKDKNIFEEIKKKLTINLLNMENKRIPLYDYIKKLVYNGKGKLNDFNVYEKMKLLNLKNFDLYMIKRK